MVEVDDVETLADDEMGDTIEIVDFFEQPAIDVAADESASEATVDEPAEVEVEAVVEIEATNQEALLRHVLSLGERAEILAPRALREQARKVLAALARRTA